MKIVFCLQIYVLLMALAGMTVFAYMYRKLARTRKMKLRNFANKAFDACSSVFLADAVMMALTLSVCVIVFMFS